MGFATILITASVLVLGSTLASIEKTRIPDYQLKRLLDEKGERRIGVGEPVEVTGVLEREPEIAPGRWYITLRVEGISSRGTKREVSGVVMLLVPVSESRTAEELAARDLRYGGRIRAMTRLERTDSFRNPGVSSSQPSTGDRFTLLKRNGRRFGRNTFGQSLQPFARHFGKVSRGWHVSCVSDQRLAHHISRWVGVPHYAQAD